MENEASPLLYIASSLKPRIDFKANLPSIIMRGKRKVADTNVNPAQYGSFALGASQTYGLVTRTLTMVLNSLSSRIATTENV